MPEPLSPGWACRLLVLAACSGGPGCDDAGARVDPDDPRARARADDTAEVAARLSAWQVGPLVAASAGVSPREAPAVLTGWLSTTAAGRALLGRWPRDRAGAIDLDRAPLRPREVRVALDGRDGGALATRARVRCGEVAVLLSGLAPPSIRLRLALPPTARACRGARADATLEGAAALDALTEAVAAGIPPELR